MRKPKPITTNSEEIADTSETLGSVVVAGVVHAAYPSAPNALCGLRRGAVEVDVKGPAPDCDECASTAAHFATIDSSTPAHWKIER